MDENINIENNTNKSVNKNAINKDNFIDIDMPLNINEEINKKRRPDPVTSKYPYFRLSEQFRKLKRNDIDDINDFVQDVERTIEKIPVDVDNINDANLNDYRNFSRLLANSSAEFRLKLLDITVNLIENNYIEKADSFLSVYYMTIDDKYTNEKNREYAGKHASGKLGRALELSKECARLEKCLDMLSDKKKDIDKSYDEKKNQELGNLEKNMKQYRQNIAVYNKNLHTAYNSFRHHCDNMYNTGDKQNSQNYYKNMKNSLLSLDLDITKKNNCISVNNPSLIDTALTNVEKYITYAEGKSFWYKLPGSTGRRRYNEANELRKELIKMSSICQNTDYIETKQEIAQLEEIIEKENKKFANTKESITFEKMDERFNQLNSHLCERSDKLENEVQRLSRKDKQGIRRIEAQKQERIRQQRREHVLQLKNQSLRSMIQ